MRVGATLGASLHRCDPSRNMARFYAVDLCPTLFGEVAVRRCWGRIGTTGQAKAQTFASQTEAEAAAAKTLAVKQRRGYCVTWHWPA